MSWADSEFQDAAFGDDRLRQRAIRVCERLAEHPGESSVLRPCRSGSGVPVLFQRQGECGPRVELEGLRGWPAPARLADDLVQ